MIKSAIAGITLTLAAAPCAIGAENGYVYGNVSSWTIWTDPGHSYHCFAEVQYEGGTSIRIGYNSEHAGLYLSIVDPSWRGIRSGAAHSTTLVFDDEKTLELSGMGIASTPAGEGAGIMLAIPGASRQSFVQDFMMRHMFTVSIDGADPIDLSLAGSFRATHMLDECQASMPQHADSGD